MTPEQAKALREPFKAEQIGKLPKPTKKENPKGKCPECGGWHGLPAVHLDYVGHAAATDRLLQVDPDWTWKPMAQGPNGEPLMTNGGLWIELTVAGVTRPGFGDEGNGKGMKEIIGDAIRNAAMRFGVALDLWAKEDLLAAEGSSSNGSGAAAGTPAEATAAPTPDKFLPPKDVQAAIEAKAGSVAPGVGGAPEEIVVSFGKKHPGKKLGDILDIDQGYVRWLASEKFDPKSPDQRMVKGAAQTLLDMPLSVEVPATPGAAYDDDIPFAPTVMGGEV